MLTKTISISNLDSAKAFVNMTSKYMNLKINLLSDNYVIDAHSIMGIISLDMNKPIELQAEGDNLKAFEQDIEAFAV